MSTVSFKGTREGLIITLGEGAWDAVLAELSAQLRRPGAQSFFHGARVLLETGLRALAVTQIEELIALLAQHEMTLTSVSGTAGTQDAFAQVRAALPAPPPESLVAPPPPPPSDNAPTYALLIQRTLRSGQVCQYAGTVVVIGDVNPGAQIVAEGDVIVWGKLRGVVHAGAAGDARAIVGALILAPTQLRIGHLIARPPDAVDRRARALPEIARVRGEQIIVEPWLGT